MPEQGKGAELGSSSHGIKGDVDDDLVVDGFFFQEVLPADESSTSTPRYSPPSKRINYDKWAALGERRRGQSSFLGAGKSPSSKPHRHIGFGYKSYEAGVWEHSFNNHQNNQNNTIKSWGKDGLRECQWSKGRDWNWRRDRRADLGEVEWVGGC